MMSWVETKQGGQPMSPGLSLSLIRKKIKGGNACFRDRFRPGWLLRPEIEAGINGLGPLGPVGTTQSR